jgi:hypothetical protein
MRNDARPIGEDAPASPVGGGHPDDAERDDERESVKHDRQSHVVHKSPSDHEPDAEAD